MTTSWPASGTLIKLRDEGCRITIVSLTDGGNDAVYRPATDEALTVVRAREATEVAARLQGKFVCLNQADAYLYDTPELRDALARVIRDADADVVFAPLPTDYHYDHVTAGQVAFSAAYHAHIGLRDPGGRIAVTPRLYYYDSIAGLDFVPSFFVDITDQMAEKLDLLRLQASQVANMEAIGGWDLVEHAEIVGRFRGLQGATTYAEAFQPCVRWPRGRALTHFPS